MQAIRKISTHTPHAGRDKLERFFHVVVDISTHTPLARRDMVSAIEDCGFFEFLLTRPAERNQDIYDIS